MTEHKSAETVLSKPLLDALEDVARWHRHQPYIWKPKSMEKLAAFGYVETEQLMFCGKVRRWHWRMSC